MEIKLEDLCPMEEAELVGCDAERLIHDLVRRVDSYKDSVDQVIQHNKMIFEFLLKFLKADTKSKVITKDG